MNERIRELAHEAGFFPELNWDHTAWHAAGHNDTFEKFAELIVRECIGCCEQAISDPVPKSVDTWLNGGSQCIQEIKHHFGIEE